ncbi:MAG: hypothetical protein U1F77_05900 [Kiritimatiellia bacterium]
MRILPLLLAALAPAVFAPAQQPAPTPPPVLTMRDFERVRKDMRILEERELDRDFPRLKKGDPLGLTSPKGAVIKGAYQWTSSNYVLVVQANNREVRVPLVELPFLERMRTDTAIRVEQLEIQSAVKARCILEAGGLSIPTFQPADAEATGYLAACGDPGALNRIGKVFLRGGPASPPDPARASVYFSAAASLGNSDAQYALGRMYFSGAGLARDPAAGVRWLTAANDAGQQEAADFLGRANVPYPARQQAGEQHKEAMAALARQRKEMAAEYIKTWKARISKLTQPASGPGDAIKPDLDNPRNLYLILRDKDGEYYYRNGEKLYL